MNHPNTPNPSPISKKPKKYNSYWNKNLKIMSLLLFCWFFFSLGCGVLWADFLNQWTIPGTGFKLGFWFAQQGSILAFVIIVFIYANLMNRVDKAESQSNSNV
tara:strand:+ start:634 stop:942 length:309 start_codon:yes stop_codon:yes gene_type:complete